jgi:hypothetical protein
MMILYTINKGIQYHLIYSILYTYILVTQVNIMQIQEVKDKNSFVTRYRLVRYAGYDTVKKQAKLEVIGSFKRFGRPSDELLLKLKDDEKQELTLFLEAKEEQSKTNSSQVDFRESAPKLVNGAAALSAGSITATDAQAQALYAAMDTMAKALRKVGHKRAIKAPKPKTDTKTLPLLQDQA